MKKTLHQLRKEYGYQATYLARTLGVSRQQYYNFEKRTAAIYPETRIKIAQIYGLKVEDIKF